MTRALRWFLPVAVAFCVWNASGENLSNFCAPEFAWVYQSDRGTLEHARGLSRDLEGNTYLCGSFRGTVEFGDTTLRSSGESDGYLLKISPQGEPIWAKQLNANSFADLFDSAIDQEGNVVVCGFYGASAFPGPNNTLRSDFLGKAQVAVLKYAPNGSLIWGRYFGADSDEQARTIAVDPNGDVYIGGDFLLTTQFGRTLLTALGTGVFKAKINKDGVLAWAIGNGSSEFQYSLAAASSGFVYALDFSYELFPIPPRSFRAVLQKLRAENGQVVWEKRSQLGDLALQHMVVDTEENIYVAGYFSDVLEFGGSRLESGTNGVQTALLKLNSEGEVLQSLALGGPSLDFPAGLGISEGALVLIGTTSGQTNLSLGEVSISFSSEGAQTFGLAFSPDFQAQWGVPLGNFGAEEIGYLSDRELIICGVAMSGAEGHLGTCPFPPSPGSATDSLFVALRPIAEPRLRISAAGENRRLAWPKVHSDYILESLDAFLPAASWTLVSDVVTNDAGYVEVQIPVSEGSGFFRLRKNSAD